MRALVSFAAGAALVMAGCGASGPTLPRITVSSPAFVNGKRIPRRYTCDGKDISPPVRWTGIPGRARQLSVVMRDPDAPGGNFIHWRLRAIPASSLQLVAGRVPAGAVQGRNSFGTTGYRGPCPPRGGHAHHYVITVTALRRGKAIALGTVTGIYARR
jgi:Raf kinase inhibitor-like YbhB/YbcL family protein